MTVQGGRSKARQLRFPVGDMLSTWHQSITVRVTATWYPDLTNFCTEKETDSKKVDICSLHCSMQPSVFLTIGYNNTDTTQMQCILPELLPAQTRNRCSAASVPTAKVQGGEGEALPVEPRKTQRTHTHATSGQSQVYAALASHCLMTVHVCSERHGEIPGFRGPGPPPHPSVTPSCEDIHISQRCVLVMAERANQSRGKTASCSRLTPENLGRQRLYKIRWKQAFLTVFEGPPDERKRSRHNNVILQLMTNGNGKDCWFVSSFPVPEGYFLRESLGQRVALPLRGKKEQLQARAAPRPIPGKRRASPGRNAAGNGTGNSPGCTHLQLKPVQQLGYTELLRTESRKTAASCDITVLRSPTKIQECFEALNAMRFHPLLAMLKDSFDVPEQGGEEASGTPWLPCRAPVHCTSLQTLTLQLISQKYLQVIKPLPACPCNLHPSKSMCSKPYLYLLRLGSHTESRRDPESQLNK
ncbi:hypothetical protein Anapl_17693 [Anas platyrhynchos]|uniref:Uncharacterized protein n=1 Tax=Anas platyrhynchos TaxID=8839 RepID=R0JJR6_ANAPL|nr:hypothetical protein Anapl_17693 [Anas platyrhynchos]